MYSSRQGVWVSLSASGLDKFYTKVGNKVVPASRELGLS
jgi:hypothetical protein